MRKKTNTKVLIIDDNHSILEYLKTVFSRYEFDIKTSTNGYDGLQEVAEFKPDIIFLDLMMPNIDGIQMLQLKKVLNDIKDIPVIVISANAGRNNVMAAIEAGADRVLAKPINLKQLKAAVDELLQGNFFEVEKPDLVQKIEKEAQTNNSEFSEKFDEYKSSLIDAIKNRDSSTIKNIIAILEDYAAEPSNIEYLKLLTEIELRHYQKPSDWLFAEMKVKEIEQNLKDLIKQL